MIIAEYKLSWKREGWDAWKSKIYRQKPAMERRKLMLTDPRKALLEKHQRENYDPMLTESDFTCCSGSMCGCGGMTIGEWIDECEERHKDLPTIEAMKLETRSVEIGKWETVQ